MKHCSGKCYLAKQLKKYAEEEDRRNKKSEKNELPEVFNNISVIDIQSQLPTFEITQHTVSNSITYHFLHLISVFHPPAIV